MLTNYTIRTANTRKKYCVARFINTDVDFSKFGKPVKMFRDTPHENEEETHRRRPLNPDRVKKYPWVIEDADNQYSFTGTVEGGQFSHYVLLMHQKTEQGSEFRIMPTSDWYNFRIKRPTKSTMTTEEAEAKLISTRKQQTERMNRVKLSGESKKDREDEEDRNFGANNDSGDDSFSAFGRFDSDEERDKLKKLKSGKKKGPGDGDNEEEEEEEHDADEKAGREDLDFQDNHSDDEEENIAVDENNTAKNANNDENSDSERKLSADGKQMQNLITKTRNAEKEEGDGEDPENPFASDSDKEDSFKLNDLIPEYVQKQKTKPKSEAKEEEEEGGSAPPSSSSSSSSASSSSSSSSTADSSNDKSDKPSPLPEKHNKKETKHKKRKNEPKSEPSSKKPKKENTRGETSPGGGSSGGGVKEEGEVTEAELRATLQQRGKIKTGKLIKLFKTRLHNQDIKTRFLNLTHRITKMVEEENTKFIVLKDDNRY